MTELQKQILDELLALEDKIQAMKSTGRKQDLMDSFEKIDRLTGQLPKSTDPELLHFLYKKSYEKARYYLQGRGADNQRGSC